MAINLFPGISGQGFSKRNPSKIFTPQTTLKTTLRPILCIERSEVPQVYRPSPGYKPTSWSFEFVSSLDNHYSMGNKFKERAEKLKEEVRIMIEDEGKSSLELLELIDDIERLGLGYCFKEDIRRALDKIVALEALEQGVYATALKFRLLRQHGYKVSEDVLRRFIDQNKDDLSLVSDVKGLLYLYEASFLAIKGEDFLDEAKTYATMHLKNFNNVPKDTHLMELVNHALELPLHHRVVRVETRWYIDAYKNKKGAIRCLLELAILDFNAWQSILQGDVQDASSWWKSIGLASRLGFIRDRLMEGFFFATGIVFEPQYSSCRIGLTKVIAFITSIDDVYDAYGSLNELEQFTDAIERWNIDAVQNLPNDMKLCFYALYNTVNEIAYHILKERGEDVGPILRKTWADLCQSFLVEAKWNQIKCTPTLEKYLDNGWRSVSGVVLIVHAHFLIGQEIAIETPVDFIRKHHDLLKWSSMIFRLCNDLATSMVELERGETANSIQCYMMVSGVSEEYARKHIRNLIEEAWTKLNQYLVVDSPLVKTALNLARVAECVYEYGDGHGAPDSRSKKRMFSMMVDPIDYSEEWNLKS